MTLHLSPVFFLEQGNVIGVGFHSMADIQNNYVGGDISGVVTHGTFFEDGPVGGLPVNLNPQMLTGYYKYYPVGPDTALGSCEHFSLQSQTEFHRDDRGGNYIT
ncbi:MAG: hypothetical protein K9G67_08120 [Bacteroidales bacterium]|nr:hypothetical protein [Bacteroidales bacterium]MCF8349785.1 hypothetical protein [Bacteroidales bacterium]MCF8376304.1 hypothetical protein [Bacteroidales bacterium]